MQRRVKGIVAGACAVGMTLAAVGCAPEGAVDPSELQMFDPSQEMVEAVYGPPPDYENTPVYDPESNMNEDVYGPPEMLDAIDENGNPVSDEEAAWVYDE